MAVPGNSETSRFDTLGERNERLCLQQMRKIGQRGPLRRRKYESQRVVKGIVRAGEEPRIPHQGRVEGGVDHDRTSPLVPGSAAIGADDAVVVDPDSDRLGIAESVGWLMATTAGVVVIQPREGIEEEHPTQIRDPGIDRSTEPGLQGEAHPSGKAGLVQCASKFCGDAA
jgi:hypothetical protein